MPQGKDVSQDILADRLSEAAGDRPAAGSTASSSGSAAHGATPLDNLQEHAELPQTFRARPNNPFAFGLQKPSLRTGRQLLPPDQSIPVLVKPRALRKIRQKPLALSWRDHDGLKVAAAILNVQAIQRQGRRTQRVPGWMDLHNVRELNVLATNTEANSETAATDAISHRENQAEVDPGHKQHRANAPSHFRWFAALNCRIGDDQ